MSYTLTGLLKQTCSVYTVAQAGPYGDGPKRVPVFEDMPCRFVESEALKQDAKTGSALSFGKAQCWFDGDVPVMQGHKLVHEDREFTVISVTKPRDLIDATFVDHTKVVLE